MKFPRTLLPVTALLIVTAITTACGGVGAGGRNQHLTAAATSDGN